MDDEAQHKELIDGIANQFKEVFDASSQGMYIYLDDKHKVCNKKFSDMLEYKSPFEWANNKNSFTDLFVADNSAKELVEAYAAAMQKMIGSHIKVTWKTKTGKSIKTEVILVPLAYEGHLFALHFVSQL